MHALASDGGDDLRRLYAKPELGDDDVSAVLDALEAADARAYCERVASERLQWALEALSDAELEPGPVAEIREVAAFLLERDY